MNIKLLTGESKNNIYENVKTIEEAILNSQEDFLIFPEAFLQERNSLNLDYKHDVELALSRKTKEIAEIKKTARDNHKAVGFGYYENDHGGLYSSYLIIDCQGREIYNYKGMSKWEGVLNADYMVGKSFDTFSLGGVRYSVLFIRDFFNEDLYNEISQIDCDAILLPACTKIFDDEKLIEHSALVSMPIYSVNNHSTIICDKGKIIL